MPTAPTPHSFLRTLGRALSRDPVRTGLDVAGALSPRWAAATACAAGAAVLHRRAHRAATLMALGAAACVTWRGLGRTRPGPARTLRLASANLLLVNDDRHALAPLAATDPDVIVLIEDGGAAASLVSAALGAGGLLSRYQYRTARHVAQPEVVPQRPVACDVTIVSKRPFTSASFLDVAGRAMPMVTVEGFATIVGVHLAAPANPYQRRLWERELAALTDIAAGVEGPLVLAGDFNAGWGNRPFRALCERAAVSDAAAMATSHGTWRPGTSPRLPALLSLDHHLGRGIAAAAATRVQVPGSDHLGVVSDLTVPGP